MRRPIALLIVLAFLVACAPSQGSIQTAIAETVSAQLLLTPSVTNTPIATITNTPRPTHTATLTKTPTPTPQPATLTALSVQSTQTKVAQFATVTQIAAQARKTATAAWAAKMAEYTQIPWRELTTYPEAHNGEKIRIIVRIFNIPDTRTIQAYVAGTYEPIYISTSATFSGIYEDNTITVYGTVAGLKCFENTMGNTVCHPWLKDAFFTK